MEKNPINQEIDKPNLNDAFNCYEQAVIELEETASNITLDQILTVLTARDAIDLALSDKTQNPAKYLIRSSDTNLK